MNRRESLKALSAGLAALVFGGDAALAHVSKPRMTVYKSPTCGCCKAWVKHVQKAGFEVSQIDVDDVAPYKKKYGVPLDLSSCHTGIVNGYAFEGHVPADLITKFLQQPPKGAKGLAVPGMPLGSPGMEVPGYKDKYDIVLFDARGGKRVWASR